MASRSNMHRRWFGRVALLLLGWLGLAGGFSRAESPVHYFAEKTFEIPYSMSPDRTFRRLHLHASSDGKSYSQAGSTLQREGAFTYTARDDGWYYFIVQIEESDGTFSPARLGQAPPSLRVCIDTKKPRASVRPVLPRRGSVAVEWSVNDENLDLQTLRLEYKPASTQRWLPLNIRQMERAQFDWDPAGGGPFDVRLIVSDKANNRVEATTQVKSDPSRAGVPPGAPSDGAGAPPPGDRKVIYVAKKSFKLNYTIDRVGPSKVKHVEVWMTRDTAQWGRYQGEAPSHGPFEVTVVSQGRYGFTLRPISGVGRGPTPPRAGDLPQLWVEVDETPPVVKLHSVQVNEGADANSITVNWQASDRFLKDAPITIYYSPTNGTDAKWEVLQANVENTGTVKCKTEGLPFEFFVKVEAMDRSGNKATDASRESVKVDLSEPNVTELSVTVDNQSNKPIGPPSGTPGAMPATPGATGTPGGPGAPGTSSATMPPGNITPTGGQTPAPTTPVTPAGTLPGTTAPGPTPAPVPTPVPAPVPTPAPVPAPLPGANPVPPVPTAPPGGGAPMPPPGAGEVTPPVPGNVSPPPAPIPPPANVQPPPGALPPGLPGSSGPPGSLPPPPPPGAGGM